MIKFLFFFIFRQVRVAVVTVVLALPTLWAQRKILILIIDNLNTRRHAKWQRRLMHKFKNSNHFFVIRRKLICILTFRILVAQNFDQIKLPKL